MQDNAAKTTGQAVEPPVPGQSTPNRTQNPELPEASSPILGYAGLARLLGTAWNTVMLSASACCMSYPRNVSEGSIFRRAMGAQQVPRELLRVS
jgi:hypothetical protein